MSPNLYVGEEDQQSKRRTFDVADVFDGNCSAVVIVKHVADWRLKSNTVLAAEKVVRLGISPQRKVAYEIDIRITKIAFVAAANDNNNNNNNNVLLDRCRT